jgi:hypothetical protein
MRLQACTPRGQLAVMCVGTLLCVAVMNLRQATTLLHTATTKLHQSRRSLVAQIAADGVVDSQSVPHAIIKGGAMLGEQSGGR